MQQIVSRRPIFMVGDSLVRNTYESLRMLMPVFDNIYFYVDRYLGHESTLGLSGYAVELSDIVATSKFG
eukprot:8548634-Pyramimonas_sp.AAC.1